MSPDAKAGIAFPDFLAPVSHRMKQAGAIIRHPFFYAKKNRKNCAERNRKTGRNKPCAAFDAAIFATQSFALQNDVAGRLRDAQRQPAGPQQTRSAQQPGLQART